MEKFILPMTEKKIFNSKLFTAYPASILSTDSNSYEYYLEQYIKTVAFMTEKGRLSFGIPDALNYLDNRTIDPSVLSVQYINVEHLTQLYRQNRLLEFIKMKLLEKNYIVAFMDETFLTDRLTDKEHFVHEFLFYGFDDTSEIFHVLAYDKQQNYKSFDLIYPDVAAAIHEGIKYYEDREIPLLRNEFMTLIKTKLEKPYHASAELIMDKLKIYTFGTPFPYEFEEPPRIVSYGADCLELFIMKIEAILGKKERMETDSLEFYNMILFYYHHAIGIAQRLRFLNDKGKVKSDICDQYKDEILPLANDIRMLCIKLGILDQNNTVFQHSLIRFCDKLKQISSSEKRILTRIFQ